MWRRWKERFVDNTQVSYSHNELALSTIGRPTIYEQFLANVNFAKHNDVIMPFTANALIAFKVIQRLIYNDINIPKETYPSFLYGTRCN